MIGIGGLLCALFSALLGCIHAVIQAVSANSSRPISMRRISLVPAPIS